MLRWKNIINKPVLLMWQHPGRIPDLARRNRGLVNQFTCVIAFAMIRVCSMGSINFIFSLQVGFYPTTVWQEFPTPPWSTRQRNVALTYPPLMVNTTKKCCADILPLSWATRQRNIALTCHGHLKKSLQYNLKFI